MNHQQLIEKYHVAAPRYTSYPTVPYWNTNPLSVEEWKSSVKSAFELTNREEGMSIYIHLPFCESLCTYCGCNTRITVNHQVEIPYIANLLKEWCLYLEMFDETPLIKEIHLGGGTPTFFSATNLDMLVRGILKNARIHPEADFSFEAHPANTTKAHLTILHNLGFKRLSLGIQDFDPKVQEIINRMQSFEQVKEITEMARAIGYTSVNFDLIYGLPLQNLTGLEATIQQVNMLKPDRIAFYNYAHVPWVKPGQRKFTEEHLPTLSQKQELYDLGRKLLFDAGYQEIGMDHFAFKNDSLYQAEINGNLHRNFMGYTHQYTQLLVGLGVSSISDTGTAFAQNVKNVEEYTALINDGNLPILKGHLLNKEDIAVRRHILNLMCKGETYIGDDLMEYPNLVKSLPRLESLYRDGLIDFSDDHISVSPLGRRFLRNICMALDLRLWENETENQLFSMV